MGVEVRGRTRNLHINYRTSHHIRMQANQFLGPEVSDVDENSESRQGIISVFNGPTPSIQMVDSQQEEIAAVAQWIKNLAQGGIEPHEIAVFVRSSAAFERANQAVTEANMPLHVLDDRVETIRGKASMCTMHLAKGLEFRAVVVMTCNDEIIPSQARIEKVGDDADLQEVYDTERHLLYVACTRSPTHHQHGASIRVSGRSSGMKATPYSFLNAGQAKLSALPAILNRLQLPILGLNLNHPSLRHNIQKVLFDKSLRFLPQPLTIVIFDPSIRHGGDKVLCSRSGAKQQYPTAENPFSRWLIDNLTG
jgi:superfamily I DNA/RNA helicase